MGLKQGWTNIRKVLGKYNVMRNLSECLNESKNALICILEAFFFLTNCFKYLQQQHENKIEAKRS